MWKSEVVYVWVVGVYDARVSVDGVEVSVNE